MVDRDPLSRVATAPPTSCGSVGILDFPKPIRSHNLLEEHELEDFPKPMRSHNLLGELSEGLRGSLTTQQLPPTSVP
jgi:hypothetical protein